MLGRMWKIGTHFTLLVRMQNNAVIMKIVLLFFEKNKCKIIIQSCNFTPGIYTKALKAGIPTKICTQMFIAVLFSIAKK